MTLFPDVQPYQFVVTQIFYIDDEIVCGEHTYRAGELFCRDMEGNWYIYAKAGFPPHYPADAMYRMGMRNDPLKLHKDHWKLFAEAKEQLKDHQLAVFRHSKVEVLARRKYENVPT